MLCFSRKLEYSSCDKLYLEIEELLDLRMLELMTSAKYHSYSLQIQLRLKQFKDEVQQLSNNLKKIAASNNMYPLLLMAIMHFMILSYDLPHQICNIVIIIYYLFII